MVHRVINHRTNRDGSTMFLIKWRELPYDQSTWEDEEEDIPGFKECIEYYNDLRAAYMNNDRTDRKKKKGRKKKNRDEDDDDSGYAPKHFNPPPDKPTTELKRKMEQQPKYLDDTGMQLHAYQLEGINWLRYSWANGTDTILADEMGLGKTIQTATFLYSLYKEGHCKGPFLIAVPLVDVN